ncbi:MAG: carbon starvation CstA family protein [Candidatus Omnitrophota bacterium]|nr:carbon starvation CstA family protein [Candidatus Omnitrophota bacterium]
MSLFVIALTACALFAAGYFLYGRLLARWFGLDATRPTPACTMKDGVDYVPAKAPLLLGQHFSAIAAAGPIVGPILGALWFGWLPTLVWIVLGAIFFGAVHDFSSLVSSVRHKARSVVELVHEHLGPRAHLLFMGFVWLSLIYVIIAFTDLTSSSFVEPTYGGGVATASSLYLLAAVAMGLCLYRWRMPLGLATVIFLPLVGIIIWFAPALPLTMPPTWPLRPQLIWNGVILSYCFVASIIPVWLLLQPRGYLGGFFLYVTLAAGIIGLLIGGDPIRYPAFLGWTTPRGLPLFPMLFVTVACGACSGFHGIVSSGTTSKQIAREPDCRVVGYGGMLLEGLVAVVALSTVMLLAPTDPSAQQSPDRIYAGGLSHFVERFGVNRELARSFALLAFATFIYDTLDVATRLARYLFQELTGWKGRWGVVGATLATLAIPALSMSWTVRDAVGAIVPAWKVFWTLFGTSNQLLAALTLLTITVWLKRTKRPWLVSALPAAFMLTMTLWSLLRIVTPWLIGAVRGQSGFDGIALVALILMALALLVLREAAKAFAIKR